MMTLWEDNRTRIAVISGASYAVAMRALIALGGYVSFHSRSLSRLINVSTWVMTIGFIIGVPVAIGWIYESLSENLDRSHWVRWIFASWSPVLLADAVLMVLGFEGAICVLMAIPITLAFGSVGGITAGLFYRGRARNRKVSVLCAALLPLAAAGVESTLRPPTSIETADTSIVIHADETTVWNNIKTVPAIRPDEIKPSWSHRIGFPLPIAATLDHEGIGGVRNASFQGNLVFIERVNDWQPNHQLGFTIKADTANIPPTTLDEHVTIGGRYFDVLDGQYRLEPIGNGNIRLHLVSHQRLSTDFNAYAALWTTSIMRDLQNSILQVIKHRCEELPPTT